MQTKTVQVLKLLDVKEFLHQTVIVKTLFFHDSAVQGKLCGFTKSKHEGLGTAIIEAENRKILVKNWAVIACYNCKLERKGGENAKWKSFGGKQLEKCAR